MLQQILKDMWVDPEILSELDEGQKQTLFCKMREEQVRRWRVWDEKVVQQNENKNTSRKSNKPKKNVDFLLGIDGEPWTWVMGEHPDDKSIEAIIEEETRKLARKQAEKEAEELRKTVEAELRKTVEAELTEYIDLTPKTIEDYHPNEKDSLEDTMEIYCSVDELRERINKKSNKNTLHNFTFNSYQSNKNNLITINNMNNLVDKRDALQEISLNKPHKVAQKVALWEKRVMEERTSEIFNKLKRKHMEAAKEAEEFEKIQEQLWKEQERKAKEAERQIREIARRAREEHRRTTEMTVMEAGHTNVDDQQYSDVPLPGARPPSKQAVVEWYRGSEVARQAGIHNEQPSPWFHGLIDRHEAESLLMEQREGSFLVRVSERIWGYAISYRANDRCKHYLVDASSGHYQFLGANQISHDTLGDLINYHSQHPITVLGGEKLLHPCPRNEDPVILKGLLNSRVR